MTEHTIPTDRALRYLADNYEQAQRLRIEVGERIRAVLQGRDETWGSAAPVEIPDQEERAVPGEQPEPSERAGRGEQPDAEEREPIDVDPILQQIRHGETLGPIPMLGRSYHRYYTEERDTYADMIAAWKGHPTFPWLDEVKGIGPTLGCKLLARLDVRKAPHASSFWSYCGLATVPGERYRCETCGLVRAWPVGFNVTGKHTKLGSSGRCKDKLVKVAGPDDGVRCAQPKPKRGEKAAYDQYAKKICYLIGTGFLKAKGAYDERIYRPHRARLEVERPGWADGRKHLTALRITEKLFLAHLWLVWRQAEGLSVSEPYAHAELGHESEPIDPWDMVG